MIPGLLTVIAWSGLALLSSVLTWIYSGAWWLWSEGSSRHAMRTMQRAGVVVCWSAGVFIACGSAAVLWNAFAR